MGLTASGQHKAPEILNLVKVVDFSVDPRHGCQIVLKEQNTQQELAIGHVPRRVFGYKIYAAVPSELRIHCDGRRLPDGRVWRSLRSRC